METALAECLIPAPRMTPKNLSFVFSSLFQSVDNKRPDAVCMATPTSGHNPGLACVMPFGEEAAVAQTSETV